MRVQPVYSTHIYVKRYPLFDILIIILIVPVAVVTAFFVCWAPFHAQRLIAIYLSSASPEEQEKTFDAYVALIHISGVLYFLSTTINPLLYNIMSNKFRDAFKVRLPVFVHLAIAINSGETELISGRYHCSRYLI